MTTGLLLVTGLIQYWQLVVIGVVQGISLAINMPARQSWIPSLVKREDLPNAIALNNAGMNAPQAIDQITDDISDARVYGGIHFRFDQEAGAHQGKHVGLYIIQNYLRSLDDLDDSEDDE